MIWESVLKIFSQKMALHELMNYVGVCKTTLASYDKGQAILFYFIKKDDDDDNNEDN